MKIVVFEVERHEEAVFSRLRSETNDVGLTDAPLSSSNAAAYSDAAVISTFIYSELNREVLTRLPSLTMIATRSTGYDHIDMAFCKQKGIVVCNVPTYGENTVAEHVFALLLSLSHRLPESLERTRSGDFSPKGLEGFDLAGKTIGVVGTGNIGRHVIRIARGFAMRVVAFDVKPDLSLAERLGFRYVGFEELLASSDVVTLHVPAAPQTRNLLSADAFSRMKDGVIVINTARGSLIDAHALIMALRSGKVGGAGLDVLPDEPLIREEAELICSIYSGQHDLRDLVADHILLHMPKVIVTPHSAFNTREAVRRIAETTVENIDAFLAGCPKNIVA
jgi:D-lactate dehydrogenase